MGDSATRASLRTRQGACAPRKSSPVVTVIQIRTLHARGRARGGCDKSRLAADGGKSRFVLSGLGAGDAESFHLVEERCALQPESGGRAFRSSDDPIAFGQRLQDVFM